MKRKNSQKKEPAAFLSNRFLSELNLK